MHTPFEKDHYDRLPRSAAAVATPAPSRITTEAA